LLFDASARILAVNLSVSFTWVELVATLLKCRHGRDKRALTPVFDGLPGHDNVNAWARL
jgi:hypothetical protein